MTRRTPLYDLHQKLGARIVDFGGWDMPLQYGSQIAEHHAVRGVAGVFDVSHMCVADLEGARVRQFLQNLLANDVGKLTAPGKALYGCMLNEAGGVIDDLIVYFLDATHFRAVVNAGTRDNDLAWMRRHAHEFDVDIVERSDLAMTDDHEPRPNLRRSEEPGRPPRYRGAFFVALALAATFALATGAVEGSSPPWPRCWKLPRRARM